MARHSHFHNIMVKKGAADKIRGKIFTKHAKIIALAAQKGGDPESNAELRIAIENARADNVPKDNIDRAIKKGTGEDKGAAQLVEAVYEGFGLAGVTFMISVVTDNKNRVNGSLRKILQEHGGRLGEAGSAAWMFERKGQIKVQGSGNREEDELKFIDAGAEDIEEISDNEFFVYTDPGKLGEVRKNLQTAEFSVQSAELTFRPKNLVKIDDAETAKKTLELLGALEEEEEVSGVAANFDIPEGLV